jgi:2-polyprenyl-6-methoxyphenol hydroxylase-like FAD-dependent oxidoreductase
MPIVRAERLRLRNWLATNIPVQWGKRVMRIEHSDEGVSMDFEDGTSAKGDILVGADGINSVGRSSTPDIFFGVWFCGSSDDDSVH